ncbi:MAG: methyltransferase domain-containing protein [Gammaproteobacteria bacterium]|nr:methyltransferase domain-containing protein [Gammaproteobacteria bacterium]MBI5616424.1 methyltransferase domain-containing protein [Gammaproteobacteria bacterium]
MTLYQERILTRVLSFSERVAGIESIRQRVADGATGHVLEIGSGIGSNLVYYPRSIVSLTTVEANRAMNLRARRRIRGLEFPIDTREGSIESLPMRDRTFDTVVSTFTLCAVADPDAVLAEVFRVLKPGGRLLFAESALSADEKLARWQTRVTPFLQRFGGGYSVDRRIAELITNAGLRLQRVEAYDCAELPRILGHLCEGCAAKDL